MTENGVTDSPVPVLIASVGRWFVVLKLNTGSRVYELAISQKKGTAQLQAADPTVVPIVLRVFGRR